MHGRRVSRLSVEDRHPSIELACPRSVRVDDLRQRNAVDIHIRWLLERCCLDAEPTREVSVVALVKAG
jgi:hypothetical protein